MSKVEWKAGTFEYPIPGALLSGGSMEKCNVV